MTLKFTILGCGTSGGVPRIGNHWGACDPANPKNRRKRCALLIERNGAKGQTTALVDTTPDLRQQLLDAGTAWLDGVLYTHDHADHTHGIDDLRQVPTTAIAASMSTTTRRRASSSARVSPIVSTRRLRANIRRSSRVTRSARAKLSASPVPAARSKRCRSGKSTARARRSASASAASPIRRM